MRLEAHQGLTGHSILGQRLLPDDELIDVRVVHIPHWAFPPCQKDNEFGGAGSTEARLAVDRLSYVFMISDCWTRHLCAVAS